VGSGRVPVGVNTSDASFNTVEKTGGEKAHTLTITEMPSHKHNVYDMGHHHGGEDKSSGDFEGSFRRGISLYRGDAPTATADISETSKGSNSSHNNLQPYITCYMWKRTV
jgi:microcystin-dependent protein